MRYSASKNSVTLKTVLFKVTENGAVRQTCMTFY